MSTAGLLLGDSAEYRELTDYGAIKKDAFTEYVAKLLTKLGYSEEEAAQKIENCFAWETMISEAMFTNEEQGRPDYLARINNHYMRDIFSLPKPLAIASRCRRSPGTMDVWISAGELSSVFLRSYSGSETMDFRRSPSL